MNICNLYHLLIALLYLFFIGEIPDMIRVIKARNRNQHPGARLDTLQQFQILLYMLQNLKTDYKVVLLHHELCLECVCCNEPVLMAWIIFPCQRNAF